MAQSESDPTYRVFVRLAHWQFSKRLHPADSRRKIYRVARIGVYQMRKSHRRIRQYSGRELAHPRRQVPQLQGTHFQDVSSRRNAYGALISRLLFCVWTDGGRPEVGCLLRADGDFDDTDIRERILPDKVNFFGVIVGLIFSLFTKSLDGTALWLAHRYFEFPPPEAALSFADAAIGALAGSGLLWFVAEGYFRLRGREGMGLGDVKMMAAVGAFMGLKRTMMTVLVGSLLGSLIGILLISISKKGRDYELPFGTFLGAGALLVLFFGTPALRWYEAVLAGK